MADIDLDALEKLAKAATAEAPFDDDADFRYSCLGCRVLYAVEDGLDPSPLCHGCAHEYAAELGRDTLALIALARRAEIAESQRALAEAYREAAERSAAVGERTVERLTRERDEARAALREACDAWESWLEATDNLNDGCSEGQRIAAIRRAHGLNGEEPSR